MRMGKLIYSLNASLDGYAETAEHSLDWAIIDDELHSWFNEQTRGLSASLYGRRMYELMAGYWPTAASDPSASRPMREFAHIWRDLPKIVFSHSLQRVDWNSRLVSGDVGDVLAELRRADDGDMDVSGPTLASAFIERGLVDEYQLVVHPVVLGGGTPFFPPLAQRIRLQLIARREFGSGVIALTYAAR
jgi:dihydrofolate reductase